MRFTPRWSRSLRSGLALVFPLLASCDTPTPLDAPRVAELRALSSSGDDGDDGAVLFIGNLAPAAPTTNGIKRYDSRGVFIDHFTLGGCCMAFGADENLYVTRQMSVQRFNGVTGALIDVVVPADPSGASIPFIPLLGPDGNLYVSDRGASRAIRRYLGATGTLDVSFLVDGAAQGMGDSQFFAFGPDGSIYYASAATHRVLRFSGVNGAFIDEFVSTGEGGLVGPSGVAFDSDGILYVGSPTTDRVLRYDRDGAYLGDFFAAGSGGLDSPVGLTFGPDGDLFVASAQTAAVAAVLRYDGSSGAFLGAFVGPGDGITTGPRTIFFKSKIAICHVPKGNPDKRHTIRIAYLSGLDHVEHGDAVGPCGA